MLLLILWELDRSPFMLQKFLRSLTDRAYTCYVNFKPRYAHDSDHLVSLFNIMFFFPEAKFILTELGRTCQYLREDLDVYVKHFCEKALDCCDLVAKYFFIDASLHRMIEDAKYISRISLSCNFRGRWKLREEI